GECYLALGHYRTAEEHLERALAGRPGVPPLDPIKELTVLTHLARSGEWRGDRGRAGRVWGRVEAPALRQRDRPRQGPAPARLVEWTWRLADSYRFRRQPDRAVERLAPLLPVHDRLADWEGKRDTLRRLAGHHAARGEFARAEKYLRQALA